MGRNLGQTPNCGGRGPSALTGRGEKEVGKNEEAVRKRDGVRRTTKARGRRGGKTFVCNQNNHAGSLSSSKRGRNSDSSGLLLRRSSSH